MGMMASQITSLTIVYLSIYSGADQRKHQSSASLAFVWGIHRWPVNSPHKWPVTRKMFPFDDVIMRICGSTYDAFSTLNYVWDFTIQYGVVTKSYIFRPYVRIICNMFCVYILYAESQYKIFVHPNPSKMHSTSLFFVMNWTIHCSKRFFGILNSSK